MPVESQYSGIWDLNPAWPLPEDFQYTWDDHLRGVKACIRGTFVNVAGEVTPTQAALNLLVDRTAQDVKLVYAGIVASPSGTVGEGTIFTVNLASARVGDYVKAMLAGGGGSVFCSAAWVETDGQVKLKMANFNPSSYGDIFISQDFIIFLFRELP